MNDLKDEPFWVNIWMHIPDGQVMPLSAGTPKQDFSPWGPGLCGENGEFHWGNDDELVEVGGFSGKKQ